MVWMLLLACDDSADTTAAVEDWVGGDYTMYTLAAEDACFDGALAALFMPEGPQDPHPFEYLVYIPDYAELPLSYTIDLREPFVSMPVTVARGQGAMMSGTGQIDGVLLNEAAYGDCTATLGVTLQLTPSEPGTAEGYADIDIRDLSGGEGRCPVPTTDPCQIGLQLWATTP
jgi:hypothetical protein